MKEEEIFRKVQPHIADSVTVEEARDAIHTAMIAFDKWRNQRNEWDNKPFHCIEKDTVE